MSAAALFLDRIFLKWYDIDMSKVKAREREKGKEGSKQARFSSSSAPVTKKKKNMQIRPEKVHSTNKWNEMRERVRARND